MKAKLVAEAANLAMEAMMESWRFQVDQALELRGQLTVREWKGWFGGMYQKRPMTRDELLRDCGPYVRMIQGLIDTPTESEPFERMVKLLALAETAETLKEGSQVFVSADDHIVLVSGLERHESWFECQEQQES